MIRGLALLALLSAPAAAQRTVGVGSFERVRVDGAFDVRIAAGPPRAVIEGDRRSSESVDLSVNGTTLTLRRRSDARSAVRVTVVLTTPALRAVTVTGSADVQVTGIKGDRVDLSVAGTGRIAVDAMEAEQAQAAIVGESRIMLSGRARLLRLSNNGSGAIDARAISADELLVRLDGPGEVLASARYTASVYSTGQGRVAVAGKPKCSVRAPAGANVSCGAP